ncbi:hypothetical protein [Metabacillus sp. FJAT-53654]|uniref:Uncharacterized protein n=1 Tax=Metabacillus rhizosphaerae TaxID=3117747 RepID=A0ABZ2MNP9_9BACI
MNKLMADLKREMALAEMKLEEQLLSLTLKELTLDSSLANTKRQLNK